METSGGIRASLAGRYASALFDLARDERQIELVGNSLETLSQALVDFEGFNELVTSPLVSREEAGKAFFALSSELGLDPDHDELRRRPREKWPQESSSAP